MEASTKGNKKLKNFVLGLFEDPVFLKDVEEIRKSLKFKPEDKELNPEARVWYHIAIDDLLKKYKLNHIWSEMISLFVRYNDKNGKSYGNICELQDVIEMKEFPLGNFYEELDDNAFPISLRISPYASQNDLIDYIKKMYKGTIQKMQEKYREDSVKIGKFRHKSARVKKRNAFIIEHQHLSAKDIATLVSKEFKESLDYTYINKIKNLNKRK